MATQIHASRYKDQPSVTLQSSALRAQFLPSIGAKLCSLTALAQDFDVLVHRPGDAYRMQSYDGVYVDGECSGLDDMFPTIDACHCERFPWRGTPLPDHGEVWSLPWTHAVEGERLRMSVHGVRLPYRLDKTVYFADAHTLRIDYALSNLSPFPFDYLWAAHPMLMLDEDSLLILPQGTKSIVSVFGSNGELGGYGDEFDWPIATLADGRQRDLSRMAPRSAARAAKYYVKGPLPEGWCALTYPSRKLKLKLAFPVETVPYLGILPNEGGWADLYNIFLEPASASFDRPDIARMRGECSQIAGNSSVTWHLAISITSL